MVLQSMRPFLRQETNSCSEGCGGNPRGPAIVSSQLAAWNRLLAAEGEQELVTKTGTGRHQKPKIPVSNPPMKVPKKKLYGGKKISNSDRTWKVPKSQYLAQESGSLNKCLHSQNQNPKQKDQEKPQEKGISAQN